MNHLHALWICFIACVYGALQELKVTSASLCSRISWWTWNSSFMSLAFQQGVIRTFTRFHPPGSCSVSSVSQRFIDRPLAPTAEVSVSARAQSEGKEKGKDRASAERDKAQQLLSAHTQSVLAWLLLATPPSSLLCSRPVSLFSGRYMCSELRLRKQSRARAKGAHTHQQTAFFNRLRSSEALKAAKLPERSCARTFPPFSRLQSEGSHTAKVSFPSCLPPVRLFLYVSLTLLLSVLLVYLSFWAG